MNYTPGCVCSKSKFTVLNAQKHFDTLMKEYTSGSLLTNLVKGVTRHFNTEEDAFQVCLFISFLVSCSI